MFLQIPCKNVIVNILTLKWGVKYGPEYVNCLFAGVKRNLQREFRFLCFTDNADGLVPDIEIHPLPDLDVPELWKKTPWLKLALFRDGLADLEGPSIFMDIDILITGQLDDLFDWHPGRRCIIRDWERWYQTLLRRHGLPGNSSVFRFTAGQSQDVIEKFMSERDEALGKYRVLSDQRYLTEALGGHDWWPKDWIVSFKRQCIPTFPLNLFQVSACPPTAKIVVFHGHPNPHEAIAGYRSSRPYRNTLPTRWIEELWKQL